MIFLQMVQFTLLNAPVHRGAVTLHILYLVCGATWSCRLGPRFKSASCSSASITYWRACFSAALTTACTRGQALRAVAALARNDLGSVVEACDSAVPFLVGSLREWADAGAHVISAQCLPAPRTMFRPSSHPTGTLGVGDPWAHPNGDPQSVVVMYDRFTDLGRISARFAAQLAHAGALAALRSLAAKTLVQSGEARIRGLSATAVRKAGQACLTVFAQSIPQVRRLGEHAG